MLILGLVILIWPGQTAMLLAGFVAAFLIIAGVVYVWAGLTAKDKGGWARIGHIALGAIYVIAGVVGFLNLFVFTLSLLVMTGILIGVSWIIDGIVSLSLLGTDSSRVWTMLYAVLSVVAGVVLLFSPLYSVAFWWLLGGFLVALGVLQIVRAMTLKHDAQFVTSLIDDADDPQHV